MSFIWRYIQAHAIQLTLDFRDLNSLNTRRGTALTTHQVPHASRAPTAFAVRSTASLTPLLDIL